MKTLITSVSDFITQLDKRSLAIISLPLAFLVLLNYHLRLEENILRISTFPLRFIAAYVLYVFVFCGALFVMLWHRGQVNLLKNRFILLLFLSAPVLFAWRVTSGYLLSFDGAIYQKYVAIIANPPLKCVVLFFFLYMVRKAGRYDYHLSGLGNGKVDYKPFFGLLLLASPFIFFFASTPGFLEAYPRLQRVNFMLEKSSSPWLSAIVYELSYAFDFLFVEAYFRGFLVLAFLRYCGTASILPMAALYCAIHFGKPAVECISSFFGGVLLGVVAYHTRSIMPGLILHLGIGWMMELAALYWGS